MKLLMLRGEVPRDRNPQEIVFDKIEECDDTWTQLFYAMVHEEDQAELWYWGGNREHKFSENFTERWIPSFATYDSNFVPDVIFCRGGFPEYDHILWKFFNNTVKIYYGAGKRFLPQGGFMDYDIFLQDSPKQLEISKKAYPKALSTLYIKPAPDNLFFPTEVEKEYDICFPADGVPVRKGHDFIYPTLPSKYSVLNLGLPSPRVKKPDNVVSYRVLKPQMPMEMQKCKIGIVASTIQGKMSWDSCPRTIPEMLACNIPIVVLDELEFWADKYIESVLSSRSPFASGEIASREDYWETVDFVLNNLDLYEPRKHYEQHLTVKRAADWMRSKIDESRV